MYDPCVQCQDAEDSCPKCKVYIYEPVYEAAKKRQEVIDKNRKLTLSDGVDHCSKDFLEATYNLKQADRELEKALTGRSY